VKTRTCRTTNRTCKLEKGEESENYSLTPTPTNLPPSKSQHDPVTVTGPRWSAPGPNQTWSYRWCTTDIYTNMLIYYATTILHPPAIHIYFTD